MTNDAASGKQTYRRGGLAHAALRYFIERPGQTILLEDVCDALGVESRESLQHVILRLTRREPGLVVVARGTAWRYDAPAVRKQKVDNVVSGDTVPNPLATPEKTPRPRGTRIALPSTSDVSSLTDMLTGGSHAKSSATDAIDVYTAVGRSHTLGVVVRDHKGRLFKLQEL